MSLESIKSPEDLKKLNDRELLQLAADIREHLINSVAKTGGHLGPNLGVVELTIAIHRVFASPADRIVFDTGHQAYVHKMLTGRTADFAQLRQPNGLSGYPSRSESPHDIIENSHASTALSWADGIATGLAFNQSVNRVVAVVGDGSLTGGMAWEAINNIANKPQQPLVIIVNDNGRSYSPTIGGLAKHLAALRMSHEYEGALRWGKRVLLKSKSSRPVYKFLHALKRGVQDATQVRGMFQDLGIKYLGPVDGHNISDLESVLQAAAKFDGPVLVHVITEKGRGYIPAELDEAERFHGVGKFDKETGIVRTAQGRTWTSAFADALLTQMRQDPNLIAITAAMLGPTGLSASKNEFPNRVIDVGIAEQHAITAAAGMSYGGLKPVVAVYASFLNRAFDQVLLDAALHREHLTIVLDRAGVTGDDGPSHNGIWDISLLGVVPNLRLFAPWNEPTLNSALSQALSTNQDVQVIRFPKGGISDTTSGYADFVDLSDSNTAPRVIMIPVGVMLATAIAVRESLNSAGISTEILADIQIQPIPAKLIEKIQQNPNALIVTLEDGILTGGFGSRLAQSLAPSYAILNLGINTGFPDPNTRQAILQLNGLTAEQISSTILQNLNSHQVD